MKNLVLAIAVVVGVFGQISTASAHPHPATSAGTINNDSTADHFADFFDWLRLKG